MSNTIEQTSSQLANFQKATKDMIATNRKAYEGEWANRFRTYRLKDFTPEEIERIVENGSLLEQQHLSRNYFQKNSFYKRLLSYYATLYDYIGILIPHPGYNKDLSKDFIQKRYHQAIRFIDKIDLVSFFQNCALNAVIEGCYYGVIQTLDKDNFVVLDLPTKYCCSRYKNKQGVDLIEFDVTFFDTIVDEQIRNTTLSVYPKKVRNWYHRYKRGAVNSKWAFIPADIGICFPFYDGNPFFLNIIPSVIDFEETVDVEKERDLEEIKKIVVQHMPHLPDGRLVFEPEEAAEMHQGAVNMMKTNKNVSVLTSYADVDAIVSHSANDANSNNIEKMINNIYYEAGSSPELFAARSNLSLMTSIRNDMMFMTPLINKFNRFITVLVNRLYANANIQFNYKILPITEYNRKEYIDDTFKLANGGYSLLLPSLASGISQADLGDLKTLENDILNLDEKLVPLSTAYTGGMRMGNASGSTVIGRPPKDAEETSNKTEQNKLALEGGSN